MPQRDGFKLTALDLSKKSHRDPALDFKYSGLRPKARKSPSYVFETEGWQAAYEPGAWISGRIIKVARRILLRQVFLQANRARSVAENLSAPLDETCGKLKARAHISDPEAGTLDCRRPGGGRLRSGIEPAIASGSQRDSTTRRLAPSPCGACVAPRRGGPEE